jgi:hypothetical protein
MLQRFFICLVFCFLAVSSESKACRCTLPDIYVAVESAHVIVVANVIGRKPVFKNDSLIRNDYVIVIQESLKGFPKKFDTLFIAAPASEIITNLCEAFYYQLGKRYIFYTYLQILTDQNLIF